MRKTIYVKNQEVWDGIKLASESRGISISEYLIGKYGIRSNHIPKNEPEKYGQGIMDMLGEINRKLDELLGTNPKQPVLSPTNSYVPEGEDTELDAAMGNASWQRKPKYSQKYRDKNPNERCGDCGKAVRFCDCEVAK